MEKKQYRTVGRTVLLDFLAEATAALIKPGETIFLGNGTTMRELARSGGKYGLFTSCCGGGLGVSTIIENLRR